MVEGHIPINSSSNLSLSFTSLQLSRNKLSGIFSFLWLNSLKNLAEIDLSWNANLRVIVNIPGWVPQFQLKYLGLSGCDLDKDIIAKPHFLGTQHLLEDLHLSDNNLFGGMPNWLFTKASTLVSVDLGKNFLTGPLDPIWYPQTSLQSIRVSMNNFVGQLPTNMSSMFPNLTTIDFSNNNFFGEIPMSLCHINTIEFLQLDNNKFSGEMPTCLFTDLPNLLILMVSNNHLGGPILGGRSNLSIGGSTGAAMHLDGNKFEGALPRNLSAEGLWIMDLHDNMISGEFDASSWSLSNLLYLNVAGNLITGEISPQICTIPGIEYLDLSNNRFNGPLLSSCNSTSLVSLNLSTNSLSGEVLWEHFNTPILFNLDVRHNMLTGNLTWVHSFTWMGVLSLGYNKFYGQIPLSLCELRYLRIIDLSHNMLSGLVPPCIGAMYFQNNSPFIEMFTPPNTEAYEVVIEAEGRFTFSTKGRELTYSHTIGLMSGIDLSGNLLSGNIPPELGDLSHVKSLNLSHNALVGTIPASLATMSDLESLDLSYNELTGPIPPELTRLRSLEVFSVAYNQLSGCLPRSGQFDTFDVDSYEGNSLLDMECSAVPSGLESCPIPPCDKMVVDVGPYAATAASFVLAFWATVAFSFCHSTGRRIVLKL